MKSKLVAFLVILFVGCTTNPSVPMVDIDLQGHRGARGLLPENSIPAILKALEFDVNTIEVDVAIDAERNIIISHEPWMSAGICSHPDGSPVSEDEQRNLKIWDMSSEQIATFDCGSRGHPGFSNQFAMAITKPKLVDAFSAVKKKVAEMNTDVPVFNIEIKSSLAGDGVLHPEVNDFVDRVLESIEGNYPLDRITIQAFDPRAIERVHSQHPEVNTGWLVSNDDGFHSNMGRLTFVPNVYSPAFRLVDAELVELVHEAGMQLTPWTVNETSDMRALIELGVDGIITDYPDRGRALLNELNQ